MRILMATPRQLLIGLPSILNLGITYYRQVTDRVVEVVAEFKVQLGDRYISLLMK